MTPVPTYDPFLDDGATYYYYYYHDDGGSPGDDFVFDDNDESERSYSFNSYSFSHGESLSFSRFSSYSSSSSGDDDFNFDDDETNAASSVSYSNSYDSTNNYYFDDYGGIYYNDYAARDDALSFNYGDGFDDATSYDYGGDNDFLYYDGYGDDAYDDAAYYEYYYGGIDDAYTYDDAAYYEYYYGGTDDAYGDDAYYYGYGGSGDDAYAYYETPYYYVYYGGSGDDDAYTHEASVVAFVLSESTRSGMPTTAIPTTSLPSPVPTLSSCDDLRERGVSPSEPRLYYASFDDTGAGVTFLFDEETDQASVASGVEFECGEILEFPDVEAATCSWVETTELYAIASSSLSLVPYSNATLLPGVLKARCVASRCECHRYANASTVAVLPPETPPTVDAIIQGPTSVSVCDQLSLASEQSSGSGGRAFAYAWKVTTTPTSSSSLQKNATAALEAEIGVANANGGDEDLVVSGETLELLYDSGVRELAVALTLTNFLFGTDTSAEFPVALSLELLPTVEIIGGLAQETTRPSTLSIKASATATSCDGRPPAERGVSYDWRLSPSNLSSTSLDPRTFRLPPYALEAGSSYSLSVRVTDTTLGTFATASCSLAVRKSGVVASIGGGTSRVASLSSLVEVSASQSYDEDLGTEATGADAGLAFWWTCGGGACGDVVDAQRTRETLEFRGAELGGVGTYTFRVNVTASDGRTAASSPSVVVVANDEPPVVELDTSTVATRVTSTARVVIYGTVGPPASLNATASSSRRLWGWLNSSWSLEGGSSLAGGSSLRSWATTPTISWSRKVATTRSHDLALPSGSLVGGSTYSLRLSALLSDGINEGIGYATVSFVAAKVPTSGTLSVTPEAGVALETLFVLDTANWVTSDLPLTYAFKSESGTRITTLRGATRQAELEDAVLPAGSPNVTVVAFAYDALGGEASVSKSVRTRQTSLRGEALANVALSLLETAAAQRSNEAACQAVVASSTAAANDTGLLGILVDALVGVVDTQDADSDLVEQSATAVEGPSGGALDSSSAATLLDLVDSLATTSSTEIKGLTDLSATSLASSLSALLDTDLFAPPDATTANASSRRRQLREAAASTLGSSVDNILAAQLADKVAGEEASTLETDNLKTAAQRVAGGAFLGLPSSDASAELLEGAEVDLQLAEYGVNPYAGRGDLTSNVLRFGVAASQQQRRRRRRQRTRLLREEATNATTTTVELQLTSSTAWSASKNGSSISVARANVTCGCDDYANASYACPDGTVLTKVCSGLPGIYALTCPSATTACTTYVDGEWTSEYCRFVDSASGVTRCKCTIPDDDGSNDFASSDALAESYAAYADTLTEFDPSRAITMFVALGALLVGCCGLVVYGKWLDANDSARRRLPQKQGGVYVSTVLDQTKLFSVSNSIDHDDEQQQQQQQRLGLAPPPAGASSKERATKTTAAKKGMAKVSATAQRFWLAFKHQHSIASWLLVYSETVPRTMRVIVIAFEILVCMFGFALETNLLYADPGCDDENTKSGCLQYKAAFWAGGGHQCEWEDCKCKQNVPDLDSSTNPTQYLFLGVVLLLTVPITKAFEHLFDEYLAAPVPDALRCTRVASTSRGAAGSPPSPELLRREVELSAAAVPAALRCRGSLPQKKQKGGRPPSAEEVIDVQTARPRDVDLEEEEEERTPKSVVVDATDYEVAEIAVVARSGDGGSMAQIKAWQEAAMSWLSGDEEPPVPAIDRWQETVSRVKSAPSSGFKNDGGPPQDRELRIVRHDFETSVETVSAETLEEKARRLGPRVAEAVAAQLLELGEVRRLLEERQRAVGPVDAIAAAVRSRWDFSEDYERFKKSVETTLYRDLMTAHKWQAEIEAYREALEPEDFERVRFETLEKYERIVHMKSTERIVFSACFGRLDFSMDAPEEPPATRTYVLAVLAVSFTFGGMAYYLLGTASQLGNRATASWLGSFLFGFTLSVAIAEPLAIFFFFVWMPDVAWERLVDTTQGSLSKYPFQQTTPNAFTLLLELEPRLVDDPKIIHLAEGVHGERRELRRDDPRFLDFLQVELDAIADYETWRLPYDTRVILPLLAAFVLLPDFIQEAAFEQVCAFVPFLSTLVLPKSLFESLVPRAQSTIVLLFSALVVAFLYFACELSRFLLRKIAARY
ncbi:hypothetical protein CTAYLR_009478 [Chrysophaeum taylorii]|uniref:PKD/REJ-like domain-containing protein n=1 Tax=Chrysophaeum taylorii TaxID=2483200 RepID=A0AAD7UKB7_9STRA|nr:hypothetical protein CTAYLR_009478 [Chrysophaeum taylorii]